MIDVCDAVMAGPKSNPRKLLGGPGELPPVALGFVGPQLFCHPFSSVLARLRESFPFIWDRGRLTLISKNKSQLE
jgi:hypothetical protein